MILYSNDDDSDSQGSEVSSMVGEDADVYLNHYRIPKLINFGNNSSTSSSSLPKHLNSDRDHVKFNNNGGKISSLAELAAQKVACHFPFGLVESFEPPVPEPLQCRIAFWSFPQDEEDVRLYTCLANGNAEVFIRAEDLISLNCVCDMLQVGFHLSANVKSIHESADGVDCFRVAITFDRRRITSCSCSCAASTFWCQHAVAVCLQRIRKPRELTLRAPVSESLQRLEKNQLQKFAQYLINELPQQILPAAQKLLDELLSGDEAFINKNNAAPDPTAGATIDEKTSWCLDDTHLSMDIHKILLKQCTAQPTVCTDPQALHATAPPAAAEYTQLLRSVRGREPEGLWNLISIVGEMMKRHDSNFFLLLGIMTEEILKCDKVVTWWFETKVSLHAGSTVHFVGNKSNPQCTSQYSSSNFCDEIVHLWRLAAMNPSMSASERERLYKKFFSWQLDILKRHKIHAEHNAVANAKLARRNLLELFPGFKLAMEGCLIDWSDWDDKRGIIVCASQGKDSDKKRPSKSKKRKRKKGAAKHDNQPDSVASTSDATTCADNCSSSAANELQSLEQDLEGSCIPEHDENDENNDANNNEAAPVADENRSGNEAGQALVANLDPPPRDPANAEIVEEPAVAQAEDPAVAAGQQQQPPPEVEQGLQVYFMDRQQEARRPQSPDDVERYIEVNIKKLKDPLETLYAKTEGLQAHGHLEEARRLAVHVANEILNSPSYPSVHQLHAPVRRRKKKGSLDNQLSIVTTEALKKISFLCHVLLEEPEYHNLVFKLVLFGVEMKRQPAATKPLEVKLINQKHDLMMLLKSIAINEKELSILREKAQTLRDGLNQYNDPFTALLIGKYIFEALVLSKTPSISSLCNTRPTIENVRSTASGPYNQPGQFQLEDHYSPAVEQSNSHVDPIRSTSSLIVYDKLPSDASLGFYAALNALSSKTNLLEADHPLLCEGTRRQRGDLALALLTYYKDDQEKLDLILKNFLDQDMMPQPRERAGKDALRHINNNNISVNVNNNNNSCSSSSSSGNNNNNGPTNCKKSNTESGQSSESSAHFMFEFAKTVFEKAGGNSSTTHLFRPQLIAQNAGRGIHRRLHMSSLRIALYALGLQNRSNPNWMDRTYSSRASFIHEQALEIGLPAIKFLCDNWDGYLTPSELASIADKAGSSNDPETKRVAADMAKSCLKYANHLKFNEVRRIFDQCKEQSISMVEEACHEIEQVASYDTVCAEVLFTTARLWYDLGVDNLPACGQMKPGSPDDGEENRPPSEWLMSSNSSHQDKSSYLNDSIHTLHRNLHGAARLVEHSTNAAHAYPVSYKYIEYFKTAYRVGIKALDASKSSLKVGSKHNPKKEEDVLWLLGLSKLLGRDCLNQFSQSAIKSISNPHLLHTICSDLIKVFEPEEFDHIDRVNTLLPLIDKCLERFVRHTRDLMKHITYDQRDYVDTILDGAQELTIVANTLTSAGHYKELLRIIDARRFKKARLDVDTIPRHQWVDNLVKLIKSCDCAKCRIGREISGCKLVAAEQ